MVALMVLGVVRLHARARVTAPKSGVAHRENERKSMTTSIETFSLSQACQVAGIGGVVSRNGASYTVGRAENGELGLRHSGEERGIFAPANDRWVQDNWTVVSRVQDAPAQTVREFFGGLAAGSHVVRPRSVDVYVWSGIFTPAENNPVVFNRTHGTWSGIEMGDQPSDWVICTDDEDRPIIADALTQRAMRDVYRAHVRHVAQNDEIVKLRSDWNKLNVFLNEYADKQGMCPDYERQLDDWNGSFDLLKLEGRKRTYRARVRIQTTHYVDVDVQASSEDAAIDEINDMYASDIMNENGDWSDYSDIDHDVQNVSRM